MFKKTIGGILLIVGTSVGGGMLALPMAVAASGYAGSAFVFIATWVVTALAAFFILEVNLWFPEGANLITMARKTLGRSAALITWVLYLVLLYALLSAYTAGGADLVSSVLTQLGLPRESVVNQIVFALIMASLLYFGVHIVDRANRFLMGLKLLAFVTLVGLLFPNVQLDHLDDGNLFLFKSSLLVIITAFGYGSIIPTLRAYFNSDVRSLRFSILVGSFLPLLCYLVWTFVVEGALPAATLSALGEQPDAISALSSSLSHVLLESKWVSIITHLFTSLCIATSFLGVGLGLTDFLADGMGVREKPWGRWLVVSLSIFPPLLIVLFYPSIFISALSFAGLCCVCLLILLPSLMVYMGRYRLNLSEGYRVVGGRPLVFLMLTVSALLFVYALWQLWN